MTLDRLLWAVVAAAVGLVLIVISGQVGEAFVGGVFATLGAVLVIVAIAGGVWQASRARR